MDIQLKEVPLKKLLHTEGPAPSWLLPLQATHTAAGRGTNVNPWFARPVIVPDEEAPVVAAAAPGVFEVGVNAVGASGAGDKGGDNAECLVEADFEELQQGEAEGGDASDVKEDEDEGDEVGYVESPASQDMGAAV
jgi:hypothetical protein